MNASEKNGFEEQWRKAFEDAEDTPGPAVWANIEAHLADAEAARYKRKLVTLRWRVAAAVALLVLATGTWALWPHNEKTNVDVAVTNTAKPSGPAIGGQQQAAENPSEIAQVETSATGDKAPAAHATNGSPQETLQPAGKEPSADTSPLIEKGENIAKTPHESIENTLADKWQNNRNTAHPAERSSAEKTPPTSTAWIAKRQARKNKSERKTAEKQAFAEQSDENTVAVAPTKQPRRSAEKLAVETPTNEQPNAENATNPTMGDNRTSVEMLAARPVRSTMAKPLLPGFNWQMNEAFWNQLAAADAENQRKKSARQSRWQLGATFTPGEFNPNFQSAANPSFFGPLATASFDNNLRVANQYQSLNNAADNLANVSRAGVSYATSVQAGFALSKRFMLESGVQYTYSQSQLLVSQYIVSATADKRQPVFYDIIGSPNLGAEAMVPDAAPQLGTASGVFRTVVDSPVPQLADNTYRYIGVPLRLTYRFLDRRIGAGIGAGVSADLFLRNRISGDNLQSIEIGRNDGSAYRNLGFSGLVSLRVDYRIGNRYHLFMEPTLRHALTSFVESPTLASRPMWWGIGTGLQYRF